MLRALVSVFILFGVSSARAYHHFIGSGYASCMTCHYNAQGSGPLNDYGRALFATEFASRWVFPNAWTEDEVADSSRFLVAADLPFWIRPGLKSRALSLETNPGSEGKVKRWITMQREASLVIAADRAQKYILVTNFTFNDTPKLFSTGPEEKTEPGWAVKDAYIRAQIVKNNWLYLGQMDKVFGIREIDHTAYSRALTANTMYDQSVGAVWNGNFAPYDINIGTYTGNMAEAADKKMSGFSTMVEYEIDTEMRAGGSWMTLKNEAREMTAMAAHAKIGIGKGNAVSMETGVVDYKSDLGNEKALYAMLQNFIRLGRGVNLLTQMEFARPDVNVGGPSLWKYGFGFLLFPLPRTEMRINAQRASMFQDESAKPENWTLQWQIHLSL